MTNVYRGTEDKRAEKATCSWAGGACPAVADVEIIEGAAPDVVILFGQNRGWRPLCAKHAEWAASSLARPGTTFAVVSRRVTS